MRLLLIHAERFSYRALQKAIDAAEEVDERRRHGSFNNVLVVFATVEEEDEKNLEDVFRELTK